MKQTIRQLQLGDLHYIEKMDTGITDDYVLNIYERISSGSSRMYGLFLDEQLASIGGYTIFAEQYAMLGRMRSDLRYRGNNLSTQLMTYIMEQASTFPTIQWVGANTQQNNVSARRVMDKLGLKETSTLYSATATDISQLKTGGENWTEVTDLAIKKIWVDQLYLQTSEVFPYECYYMFPASESLFIETDLARWSFFENRSKDRVLITKQDYKRNHYLHVIYPWNDFFEQPGFWETITTAQHQLSTQLKATPLVWMDLTPSQKQSLPKNHPFDLPSPWLLYGKSKKI
ncbi:GNAT family N-acetyltransferase [Planococcus donghaensis]|uniref:GNAT family N-acetyltransferase n=1 Tax=Planococcus donghaensis TaxID=414778 RepID=A0A1C7EKD6_9BACL|nr:GNAT family N-acetyltransferase [Planococcus donghaensis]ANU24091.1 GNAT family N-acetyltransferase [Planococcus donghaensis]